MIGWRSRFAPIPLRGRSPSPARTRSNPLQLARVLKLDRCPSLPCPVRAVPGGDRRVASISAASILAKTVRDLKLVELDRCYPAYGFAHNKGYGTPDHLAALSRHGPCPEHRLSFGPVRQPSFDF